MRFETILERLSARQNGSGWMANCPAHDDAKASLSLSQGNDGRTLLHCFAGCEPDAVLRAVGLHVGDLFADESKTRTNGSKPKLGPPAEVYDYRDEADSLLFQCVRYAAPEKTFRQRRPDSQGGWLWNLNGVRRVLFGLPDLIDQTDVFVVEGEKDVLALRALGFAATTNPCGAGKWLAEHADQLRVAGCLRVVILPDEDEPGRKHGQAVAASCAAVGLGVKVIDLPGLPAKGDVSDWLLAGHTRDELVTLVAATSEWTPTADAGAEPTPCAACGFSTPLPNALARLATMAEPRWLVQGLVPGDGITMLHSQPREWKSLTALQLGLSVAAGIPVFGLAVDAPGAVLYVTNEDAERRVLERLRGLITGLALPTVPTGFHLSAGAGVDLDDLEWQVRIIAEVQRLGVCLVIFDPLRSVTACVDQGPSELKPFAGFCRRLMRETGVALLLVHHDAKPQVGNPDTRRRPQRASGGGLFSIADYPIAIDPIGDGHKMLSAHGFKFSADPAPIVIALVTEGESWRLVSDGRLPADANVLHAAILAFLEHTPGATGSGIAKGIRRQKKAVLDALDKLASSGLADSVKERKRTTWFIRRAVPDDSGGCAP